MALLPFVAFVLLLPRGGEAPPEETPPSRSPSPLSPLSIPLAFPYDMTAPSPSPEPTPEAEVVDMQEPPTVRQCSDGVDNDRDRRVDFPSDTGCGSRNDNSEASVVRPPAAQPSPPPPPPAPPAPAPPPPAEPPRDDGNGNNNDGNGNDDDDDVPDPQPPDDDPNPPDCDGADAGFPGCEDVGLQRRQVPGPTQAPSPGN